MTSQASAPKIPQLWVPLPSGIHPSWREIDEGSAAWLDRFGLYSDQAQRERLTRISVGEITGRGGPDGRLAALQWTADFLMWLFAFDDEYCDEGPAAASPDATLLVITKLQRVVEVPWAAPVDDNYSAALRELRLRLDDLTTPVQTARWAASFRAYLQGQIWMAANSTYGRIPSLSDHLAVRLDSSGVKIFSTLSEIIHGYDLPAADYDRHDVRGFVEVFAAIIGWSNDLVSYHKERQRSQDGYGNIVDLIAHERQCSVEEAVDATATMHTRAMALYLRLRDQILRDAGPELRKWITDCDSWIRADYDWSLTTNRYVNPEDPADLPAGSAASPFEEREADQPLPIAGIAWWWTLLKD
ncbi:(+)-(1(10)E,4E,6S,7R)-germacradien-6-ol synthase [Streptomyces sp. JH34]|uniref:(+)-(1(10)E,4E,6S,7R)-germacradien-6-ol synthase n=1 Tax=unclassified Streptomyces TaxID=2593676 RepID=UPI0023F7E3AA|nr:(+)-(1(10)E,4E,6S,7R)-germacradien-6-ol synthase [Streptomyces sp. JH34]MDF6018443.1 terpene synthase [Streptomyces sp. JH34]